MDIGSWLRSLGLETYAQAFRDNKIDGEVLPKLTAEDLKDLGVVLVGDRRRLLSAIGALREANEAVLKPSSAQVGPSMLQAKPSSSDAERRQLTLMFCDLVGSTALSTEVDPEDLRELINSYHTYCAERVTRSGGYVAKYMGDGVLAYFGYPEAHEDDAIRAINSGLSILNDGYLPTRVGFTPQIRIGIATGLVVVGDLIGQGSAQERNVVGETPNLAARLQSAAEPGTLVIAASFADDHLENGRGMFGGASDLDHCRSP